VSQGFEKLCFEVAQLLSHSDARFSLYLLAVPDTADMRICTFLHILESLLLARQLHTIKNSDKYLIVAGLKQSVSRISLIDLILKGSLKLQTNPSFPSTSVSQPRSNPINGRRQRIIQLIIIFAGTLSSQQLHLNQTQRIHIWIAQLY